MTITAQLYMQCFLGSVAGIIFHIIVKLIMLRKRSKAANASFSVGQYLKDDWLSIMASILASGIVIFLLDELARFKPAVLEYIKFFFVTVGYMGSSALQAVLSNAEKKILKVIDEKTNIADAKN